MAVERVVKNRKTAEDEIPYHMAMLTYVAFGIYTLFGYIQEYYYFFRGGEDNANSNTEAGFSPLFDNSEYFYTRRIYGRVRDCFSRPICSAPGAYMKVLERKGVKMNFEINMTGREINVMNLSSYNYLGFAETKGKTIENVISCMREFGGSTCSSRLECGTTTVHRKLEKEISAFLGKEDAVLYPMGFITNSLGIPVLVEKGDLVISDRLNHASIIRGCRNSGAKVITFQHNCPKSLERVIRDAIAYGQPRTRRPWGKIFIVVEGIYSMEGEICRLAEIVEIKKKYRCYLYVDEAHSIGALGETGRGVAEYWDVDTADIDIMMGTFTKSFGSVGGYIAGDKKVIDLIRLRSSGSLYDTSMAAPAAEMTSTALRIISGADGTDEGKQRLQALHDNANYFRNRLMELGYTVLGDDDSPVVPMMIFNPATVAYFSREMLKLGIAVVIVGYPAVAMFGSRCRFCLSSGHTRRDLDMAIEKIDLLGKELGVRFGDLLAVDE